MKIKIDAAQLGSRVDEYISAALKSGLFKNNIFDPRNLKAFNKYMMIAVVIIVSYFLLDLFLARPSRDAASVISSVSFASARPASSSDNIMPIDVKAYSHYSNKISSKNIFAAGPEIQAESQAGALETGTENVGLVGIIPGASPQAIIEDKKSQKTYYLIKGQTVNDITVEDISEGSVTLEYRGKKTTLLL